MDTQALAGDRKVLLVLHEPNCRLHSATDTRILVVPRTSLALGSDSISEKDGRILLNNHTIYTVFICCSYWLSHFSFELFTFILHDCPVYI